jgi:hypothetical protein
VILTNCQAPNSRSSAITLSLSLTRDNGRMLNKLLALVNISEIVQLPQPADQTT